MATQIIMDRTGDTRHDFNPADQVALAEAEERFKELTAKGFLAVALSDDGGPGKQLRKFDGTVIKTLFVPALQGG